MFTVQIDDVVATLVDGCRTLDVTLSDGTRRRIDMTQALWGPVFEPLAADDAAWLAGAFDAELGTIVWATGADLAPEWLASAGVVTED